MRVGGFRGGLSTLAFGCQLVSSFFVAASVGGGAACSGGRVVRGGCLECGARAGGGCVCRECAALASGVEGRRRFGPTMACSHRAPAQVGRHPGPSGRRSPGRPSLTAQISYYIAYCPAGTTPDELIRIAGSRWAVGSGHANRQPPTRPAYHTTTLTLRLQLTERLRLSSSRSL